MSFDTKKAFDDLDAAAEEAKIPISRYDPSQFKPLTPSSVDLRPVQGPARPPTNVTSKPIPRNKLSSATTSKSAPIKSDVVQPIIPVVPVAAQKKSLLPPSTLPKPTVPAVTSSGPLPEWKQRMYEEQAEEEMHSELPYSAREEKAAELKYIIDTRLSPELERLVTLRDSLCKDIDEYEQLRRTAQLLIANDEKEVMTKVDLGNSIFAHAKVPNCRRMMVEVGLGFFVEHTLPETVAWCGVKLEHVRRKLVRVDEESATLSARIKVLHDGIGTLLGMEHIEDKRHRELF